MGMARITAYSRVVTRIVPLRSIVFLLGVLSACVMTAPAVHAGWVEDFDGKTLIHLKVWLLPEPSRTDTFTRSEVTVVREFVRSFPAIFAERYRDKYKARPDIYGRHNWDKVEIELHQYSGIQVEGVESALLAIAGGVSPDVMYVNFRQSDTYIQQGFLYPLDKPEDGYLASMTEEQKAFRIHPKIWPVIERKGPGGKKHVWAIPYGGALGKVALYRKDLFDEAGIPYPDNNWTWDDLYEACRKICDPARGIFGIRLGRGKHEAWYWITFLWSAGGEALVYDEATDEWRAVFDSREAAVALDYYVRLCTEPWVDETGQKRRGYAYREADWVVAAQKWERGEIGMQLEYIDEKLFTQINPDVTGMVPAPIGPTGIRGAELNSRMMGMFAGIEDPVIRDAAWEYMRYYDCEEAVRIRTKVMVEGGLGRFINPKYLRMFGYPELVRLAPKGWSEIFEIAIETGKPEPYGRNSNLAYDIMTIPIQQADDLAQNDRLPEDDEERLDVLQGLLRKAVAKANEEMLGIVAPRERLKRRITAVIALIAIVAAFTWVFRRVVKAFAPPAVVTTETRRLWGFRRYAKAYLILIPAVATVCFWQYIPLGRGSVMAFQDYRIMGGSQWVWLDNFGDVLWNADWWAAVWNSVRYSLLVISLTFLPPVILAVLLQEVPRGKLLFRTIFYLPAVMTGLVVILLWKSFYEESEFGVLNAIVMRIPAVGFIAAGAVLAVIALLFARRLIYHEVYWVAALFGAAAAIIFYTFTAVARPIFAQAGVPWHRALFMTLPEPYRWLGDSDTAMFACVLPMVWAGMGPGCLIYLAALKGIAEDFYEAADVDGATFIDKILFVVFPILKPLLIINFVGVFIGSWKATANILVMTGGGGNTEVAGLHIFYKAFIFLQFGPATAMAWVLGLLLIGFTVHQLRILSRLEFRTTGDKK